jgi:CubicO group peptidase (beta-lactamase class C family)
MSNLIKTSVLALSLATFLPHLRMPAQQSSRIMKIASYYYHRDGFMGTVAVARHGELVFEQSYGYANLKPQAPFTPDTSFPIGSLSKQFTAAAILLLQENGKLKTSDPIARFYKDAPAAWRRITLRNLLTQTSGIPDFDFSQAVRQGSRSPEETIRPLTAQPLKFEPGAGFDYANANYVLLGLVIEKVSGESYCRFLKLRIFDPVGLTHTGCGWRSGLIPHGASGYRPAAQGFVPAEDDDTTGISGAGSLYSTIGDLISWTTALHGGEVVNHSSLREMTTPFLNGYAYGLEVDGDKRIGHNGVIDGFSSSVDYLPKTKTVVVVLSNVNSPGNQSSPGAFAMEVELMQLATDERSILPSEGKELSLPEGTLRGYVGRYRAKDSHNPLSFAIDLRGNHLFLQLDGTVGSPAQLRAESQSDFYLADQEVEIDFDAPGSAVVTDYNAHTTTSFLRQGEPAVPGANP